MLIFHYAREGTLRVEWLLKIADCSDVATEGVGGAKSFFEAKVKQLTAESRFEKEIKEEQEKRKVEEEEKKARRAAFKEKAAFFQ